MYKQWHKGVMFYQDTSQFTQRLGRDMDDQTLYIVSEILLTTLFTYSFENLLDLTTFSYKGIWLKISIIHSKSNSDYDITSISKVNTWCAVISGSRS